MSKTRIKNLKVFEHETIKYGEDRELTKMQFDALVKFNDKNNYKYFTVVHKGIKFKQYVGVISVDNLTIEILPKVDKSKDKGLAYDILLDMLKKCKKINVASISNANLRIRHDSLLEYYLQLFLDELYHLMKTGLVKKYRFEQDNLRVLKGKLLVSQQIKRNEIHKERFFVQHQKYDYNHLLNNILIEAFNILPKITNNQSLISYHQQIQLMVPEIKNSNLNANSFTKIKYDRKTHRYKNAVELAVMIISNYMPDLTNGHNNLIAILFDMNKLFEEYIFRSLKRSVENSIKVEIHKRKVFWKKKLILPDILLTNGDEKYIIDTKWKSLSDNNPADDDLKQMFVYNEYFKTSESILLYPRTSTNDPVSSNYIDKMHSCRLEFVDLVKNGKINKSIGDEVKQLMNI